MQAHMVQQFAKFVSMIPYLPDELQVVVDEHQGSEQGHRPHRVEPQHLARGEAGSAVSTLELRARLEKLSAILNREIELLELGHKIQSQVQTELNKNQKEFYLRQQMKAIQKRARRGRLAQAPRSTSCARRSPTPSMPRGGARRPPTTSSSACASSRPSRPSTRSCAPTSSGWSNMPWATSTEDNLDIPHARRVLDEDHFDLEKVKDRILEYLAVRKLRKDPKGPILCFVGPPGRRQDLARPLDRHAPWGGSSCASRSAASATRPRSAATAAPTSARCPAASSRASATARLEQPDVHARRDRQARRRLPRRSRLGAARGARSRAEPRLRRPLPRRPVRPLEGDVRHDRELPRSDPARPARPHGGDRALRLHRGGEGRRSPGATSSRSRSARTASPTPTSTFTDEGLAQDHPQLHARGRAPEPRARDRPRLPQGRARRHRRAGPSSSPSRPSRCASSSAPSASSPRSPSAAASPASRSASPGRRTAATSSSSSRPRWPARRASRSPATSARS